VLDTSDALDVPDVAVTPQLSDSASFSNVTGRTINEWNASGTVTAFGYSLIPSPLWLAPEIVDAPATVNQLIIVQDARLASPLLARLEITPQFLILVDVATGIFGLGSNAKDVVDDFLLALRQHADVLAEQESLSADLQDQLAYLQSRLTSVQVGTFPR
jgi:hypothetical protein